MAHNLLRWVARLGLHHDGPVVAKTLRWRLLTVPGRLTRSARRNRLHLPARWPWADEFRAALTRLRALTAPAWRSTARPLPDTTPTIQPRLAEARLRRARHPPSGPN